jgi:hypothetical protein
MDNEVDMKLARFMFLCASLAFEYWKRLAKTGDIESDLQVCFFYSQHSARFKRLTTDGYISDYLIAIYRLALLRRILWFYDQHYRYSVFNEGEAIFDGLLQHTNPMDLGSHNPYELEQIDDQYWL